MDIIYFIYVFYLVLVVISKAASSSIYCFCFYNEEAYLSRRMVKMLFFIVVNNTCGKY